MAFDARGHSALLIAIGHRPREEAGDAPSYVEASDPWLERFHAGDRGAMAACYQSFFAAIDGAVGRVLAGADRETAVHEVFARLLSDEGMRRSFVGGSLRAWLTVVARNHAVDFLRRHRREELTEPTALSEMVGAEDERVFESQQRREARALVRRFREEHLPEKWAAVFDAVFLKQLSQREAAALLGMRRTTLAYQESRIRARLRRFVLRAGRTP